MINIMEKVNEIKKEGYNELNAQAKFCQDIVLQALARSNLSRNVTIKGGVVMRSISGNARRATQDIDIDFIRYSLEGKVVLAFVEKLDNMKDISISIIGNIEELKQQDYHGKRIHIQIADTFGNKFNSKIDLGVHNNLQIEQEEYCFDVGAMEDGVSLLINSKEQMVTEKLRAILKFGIFSTRYKDVYDIYYLSELVDKSKLQKCFETYIYVDAGMKENNLEAIVSRVQKVFLNQRYVANLKTSKKNWLDISDEDVLADVVSFFKSL